jgi:hypothetical protein
MSCYRPVITGLGSGTGARQQDECASHLAWRSRAALSRFAANDPAHRRIMPQALGVVHILISGKATK